MKNEADIISASVEHLFAQGLDAVLIADNGSSDETPSLVRRLSDAYPVFLAEDREPSHYQGEKLTQLARWARLAGAEWIVPFDADELWFATDVSVADLLRTTTADVVRAALHNAVPRDDSVRVGDQHGWRLGTKQARLHKVAFRAHPLMRIAEGNHDVDRPGPTVDGLHIAHFPYRSRDQMARKVRAGARALQPLPADVGVHWRELAELDDEMLTHVWHELLAGGAPTEVGWVPEGSVADVDVFNWPTWRLDQEEPSD